MVIGKGGKGIETLKIGNLKTAAKGETLFPGVQSFTENEVFIDVQEVRKAETNAQLVAENIAHAARAPRRLPPRHEEGRADGHEVRRQGHPRPLLGSPRRQRDEPRRDVPRGPRSAAHAARRHRVRPRRGHAPSTASSASRCWIFKGEVLQRRVAAVAVRARLRAQPRESSCSPRSEPSTARCRRATTAASRSAAATSSFGDFGHAGDRAGSHHVAPDRGRAYGDHPPREARRQALDPRLPGHARSRRSPLEVRMGGGKGGVEEWAADVRPGRVMYETPGRRREDGARGLPPRRPQAPRRATSSSSAEVI